MGGQEAVNLIYGNEHQFFLYGYDSQNSFYISALLRRYKPHNKNYFFALG